MSKEVVFTDKLMRPIAHFSHASRVGNVVHIGATAGVFPGLRLAGETPGTIDIVAQTHKMFENLETALGLMGASISNVVRLKTYIVSPRDIGKYREIYQERFSDIVPAHTIVASWDFPLPQAAIELDAVAVVGGKTARLSGAGLAQTQGEAAAGVLADGTHYATARPVDANGNVVPGDFKAQAAAAFRNLAAMLESANLTPRDVCNIHMTLSDMRDVEEARTVLGEFFGENIPSLTIVGALLDRANIRITVESIAVAGGGERVGSKSQPIRKHLPAPGMLAGDVLYLGAQSGADGSVEQQTRIAWQRQLEVIDAAGLTAESIVRSNNVLVDWRDYAGFNAGYGAYIPEPYVPRATVQGHLGDVAARVQTECIAHRAGADAKILQVAPLAPRNP